MEIAAVREQLSYMLHGSEAIGLVGFRHDVADVNLHRASLRKRFADAINEKIRNDACEERARSESDQIRVENCIDCRRERLRIPGHEREPADRRHLRLDRHLTLHVAVAYPG